MLTKCLKIWQELSLVWPMKTFGQSFNKISVSIQYIYSDTLNFKHQETSISLLPFPHLCTSKSTSSISYHTEQRCTAHIPVHNTDSQSVCLMRCMSTSIKIQLNKMHEHSKQSYRY